MNRVFKNWANNKPVSLIKYILDYVQKYPDTKIYVGTDSQNSGLNTVYVTTIVLRQGLRGGHILYNYHKISIIKDFWSRLWRETELSLEIAQFISDNSPLQIEAIDLDYNDDDINSFSVNRLESFIDNVYDFRNETF